jgi:hypothetical protein
MNRKDRIRRLPDRWIYSPINKQNKYEFRGVSENEKAIEL